MKMKSVYPSVAKTTGLKQKDVQAAIAEYFKVAAHRVDKHGSFVIAGMPKLRIRVRKADMAKYKIVVGKYRWVRGRMASQFITGSPTKRYRRILNESEATQGYNRILNDMELPCESRSKSSTKLGTNSSTDRGGSDDSCSDTCSDSSEVPSEAISEVCGTSGAF